MCTYKIITDSCCDFPVEMYRQLAVDYVPLSLDFRGQVTLDRNDDSLKDLYDGMRAGEAAKTSAANPDTWAGVMEPHLEKGLDVLVLAFSSGLSTTYQSAVIASQELMEKYPDRTIRVVDTLAASLGQGLLVWYVCQQRDKGATLEEAAQWAEDNKQRICHWFTVDDLMHLKRGGRIGAATAVVGTMLQIKPVLHVDDEGHLVNVSKARGRKASIEALAKRVSELGAGYDNSTVFLSHGDCREEAVLKQFDEKNDAAVEAYTRAEANAAITGPAVNCINNKHFFLVFRIEYFIEFNRFNSRFKKIEIINNLFIRFHIAFLK